MGGRGNSFGRSRTIEVTSDNSTFRYQQVGGKAYNITDGAPIEVNLSLKEIARRAQASGATVRKISDRQLKKESSERNVMRKEMSKMLDRADVRHGVGARNGGRYRKARRNGRTY